MGWYPVNSVEIKRVSDGDGKREIVITWTNDVTGKQEKRFEWEEKEKAVEFASKEFNQLAM